MDKHHFKLLLGLVLIAVAVAVVFMPRPTKNNISPIPQEIISAAPSPSPVPDVTQRQDSPDGTNSLIMKKQINGSVATYTLTTAKGSLYTQDTPATSTVGIPFNTWSPDNKMFFIKEETGTTTNWYVFPGGANISEFFNQKLAASYRITEVTGWASNTLLIVNTDKNSGGQGFSYWFDTTSHSFIQLAERFD